MSVKENISDSLNEQQVLMLRLLKTPLPDADFIQIRRLAVKLLAKQLDESVDQWENENGIKESDYEQLSAGHFRRSAV